MCMCAWEFEAADLRKPVDAVRGRVHAEKQEVVNPRKGCHFLPAAAGRGWVQFVMRGRSSPAMPRFEQMSYVLFKLETVVDTDVFRPAVCTGLSPNSISNNVHCLKSLYSEVVPMPI